MTMGSDGLPLGDLNWFPTDLADFEANKDQYIAELEALAGAEIVENVVWDEQAENGTVGGDCVDGNRRQFRHADSRCRSRQARDSPH